MKISNILEKKCFKADFANKRYIYKYYIYVINPKL